MPDRLFHLNIVTPEKTFFSADIASMVIPADSGFMGVLAHHAPIVASLGPGRISIKGAAGNQEYFYSGGEGFFEFSGNSATLVLSACRRQG